MDLAFEGEVERTIVIAPSVKTLVEQSSAPSLKTSGLEVESDEAAVEQQAEAWEREWG